MKVVRGSTAAFTGPSNEKVFVDRLSLLAYLPWCLQRGVSMADQIMVSAASGETFVLAKATGVEGLRIVKNIFIVLVTARMNKGNPRVSQLGPKAEFQLGHAEGIGQPV